eukprot:jgi/Tetstr1/446536/TSEL_034061.t1
MHPAALADPRGTAAGLRRTCCTAQAARWRSPAVGSRRATGDALALRRCPWRGGVQDWVWRRGVGLYDASWRLGVAVVCRGRRPTGGAGEERWLAMYEQLAAFKKQEGHCRVPNRYATNPKLGRWVMTQRAAKKKGELSEERVALLEELGFEWRLR